MQRPNTHSHLSGLCTSLYCDYSTPGRHSSKFQRCHEGSPWTCHPRVSESLTVSECDPPQIRVRICSPGQCNPLQVLESWTCEKEFVAWMEIASSQTVSGCKNMHNPLIDWSSVETYMMLSQNIWSFKAAHMVCSMQRSGHVTFSQGMKQFRNLSTNLVVGIKS